MALLISGPKVRKQAFGVVVRQMREFSMDKVRLKWVKNRGLDHVIDVDTEVKAAMLLKDAIKRSPTGFLTSKAVNEWQFLLGLSYPVTRFMRRYPTIFHEFRHPRYPSLPSFNLTKTATLLDSLESKIHLDNESDAVQRLCKLLMMTKSRSLPYRTLIPLRWDLGLPDHFGKILVPKYPDLLRPHVSPEGDPCLALAKWPKEFAVSALQMAMESSQPCVDEYRSFKRGDSVLKYEMSYPRGYGVRRKVIAWMKDFDNLPYVSPYEDFSGIKQRSDLMEKRVVGVLHEALSLTLHKKTKRNYLRGLMDECGLPDRFTRIFTRYPGIFYLSLKCKTTTVVIREGYKSARLVKKHPLTRLRDKFYYVMRTGLMYRSKGEDMIPKEELFKVLDDAVEKEELDQAKFQDEDDHKDYEEISESE